MPNRADEVGQLATAAADHDFARSALLTASPVVMTALKVRSIKLPERGDAAAHCSDRFITAGCSDNVRRARCRRRQGSDLTPNTGR